MPVENRVAIVKDDDVKRLEKVRERHGHLAAAKVSEGDEDKN